MEKSERIILPVNGSTKHRNVFPPNELFRSSTDVVYAYGIFKSVPKFSHQYLQFTDSATYTISHFQSFYWPINIKRHMGMYSDYSISGCKMWFVQQQFMLTSKPPVTTRRQQCGQAAKLSTSFPFRTAGDEKYDLWNSASRMEGGALR